MSLSQLVPLRPPASRRWGRIEWAVTAALAGSTLLTYSSVLWCDFVNYDDQIYVTENPYLHAGVSRGGLAWGLTTFHFSNWHPLVWWSYLLDHDLYGLNPAGFHATNLLWHVGSAIVLFAALRRLTGATWPSALVAAMFALHPLHVQPVAWVSERKGVISTFFWMLTLWTYARYAEKPGLGRYALVFACLALGLMAKQMLVTLPCVLLLLDAWPLRRWDGSANRLGVLVVEKLPLFALCGAAAALTVLAQQRSDAIASLDAIPLPVRIDNAVVSYVAYLGQALMPIGLAAHYPHPGQLPAAHVAGAAALLVAITAFVLWLARRAPYATVGWLWYLGTLVPVVGLVQLGTQARADRYAYVPLVGTYIIVAWSLAALARRWSGRAVTVVALATLVLLQLGSWLQLQHWRDSERLWRRVLAVTGASSVAHHNLGAAVVLRDPRMAEFHYHEALRCDPDYALSHLNLGLLLLRRGDNDAAIAHLRRALMLHESNPYLAVAHYHLGLALLRRGERAAAVVHFHDALRLNPRDELALVNLAIVARAEGDPAAALRHLQRALRLNPNLAVAHYHLGLAYLDQNDAPAAVLSLRRAAELRPELAEIRRELAVALQRAGQRGEH